MSTSPHHSVPYVELDNSPRYTVDERGVHAVRRFWLGAGAASDAVLKFSQELMGWYKFGGSGSNQSADYVVKALPLPGWPNSYCTSLQIDPFTPGKPTGDQSGNDLLSATVNTYPNGTIITAHYESDFSALPDHAHNTFSPQLLVSAKGTYVKVETDHSGEVLTTPGRNFYWESVSPGNVLPTDVTPGLIIPTASFTIHWFWVPLPPWTNMRTVIGKTNLNTFLGYNTESVMFVGAQAQPCQRMQADKPLWRVSYRFATQVKYKMNGTDYVGWNHLFKEVAAGTEPWTRIVDVNGDYPHPTVDFSSLLFSFGV